MDVTVAEFGKKCRRLQRVNLSYCNSFGTHGIVELCTHCPELTRLDLCECKGIEDTALACFHEHRMSALIQVVVNLMNCCNITGVGVQWLADGCPNLISLNVKGTKANLTTLNIISERYPYSRIKVGKKFLGLSPLNRMRERKFIREYFMIYKSASKIQSCYRAMEAKEVVKQRRRCIAELRAAQTIFRAWTRHQGQAYLKV
ncbi:unnamed protein product [Choristocarpus tenellus]